MYALKIKAYGQVCDEIGGGMLTKRENEVMNAVYALCQTGGVCLLAPTELLAQLPVRKKYTEEGLEDVLKQLALDDYFELLSSERKGEKMYVISLRTKGFAYKRCALQQRRDIAVKMLWAATSAVVAFLVGWVLRRIF